MLLDTRFIHANQKLQARAEWTRGETKNEYGWMSSRRSKTRDGGWMA